ncbi:hypothetical protein [Paenibacillus lactis]|uniref:Uncharacterized protein n=1 Tax=Paenibacillus lactis 154 TaxID=743719 RepID=G4HEH5_9BACL|nr:hypothetical protein [Paenibacillus lactis]EHB65244.1 hypothetical protein PaelaDRAFT_2386 [Paenibacillus lactis 154]
MRPLTAEEKALSKAAKQRANKQLQAQRLRGVKGDPVVLEINGNPITLNYEMLRRFIRTLKNRRWNISMDTWSGPQPVLIILHYVNSRSNDRGFIELYELPPYQKELLTDLPVIEIET